ncbi:MAG: hypothetical protein H0U45_13170 [Tatlockia sp.]|nr:hypothetical protein [Tatlockia sp.]
MLPFNLLGVRFADDVMMGIADHSQRCCFLDPDKAPHFSLIYLEPLVTASRLFDTRKAINSIGGLLHSWESKRTRGNALAASVTL